MQQRDEGLSHAQGSDEIGGESLAQGFGFELEEAGIVIQQDGGVVDENVEVTKTLPDGSCSLIDAGLVSEIELHIFAAKPGGGVPGASGITAGNDDPGATFGKKFRRGKADTAGGAGNENKLFHRSSLALAGTESTGSRYESRENLDLPAGQTTKEPRSAAVITLKSHGNQKARFFGVKFPAQTAGHAIRRDVHLVVAALARVVCVPAFPYPSL